MKTPLPPRKSVVAGRFYPGGAGALRAQVAAFLGAPQGEKRDFSPEDVLAVLLPHAGYVFSGAVAGAALAGVDIPPRLVMLGPNHMGRGAPLSVWNGGAWETPLGSMEIDGTMRDALLATGCGFTGDAEAHAGEHSLEVLVPFFQVKNPGAAMVPVTVSGLSLDALRRAGEALAGLIGEAEKTGPRPLIIISSDMSHYLPHEKAVRVDDFALRAFETLDAEHYCRAVLENNISMCGVYPATLALYALAALGAGKAHRAAYATSGETGRAYGADMERVVGYAGMVITR